MSVPQLGHATGIPHPAAIDMHQVEIETLIQDLRTIIRDNHGDGEKTGSLFLDRLLIFIDEPEVARLANSFSWEA